MWRRDDSVLVGGGGGVDRGGGGPGAANIVMYVVKLSDEQRFGFNSNKHRALAEMREVF